MYHELIEAFTDLENDPDVTSIIIAGGEYVFLGTGMKELSFMPNTEVEVCFASSMKCLEKIYLRKKTLIAAVGVLVLTNWFSIAVVCDLIIASESSIFAILN